MVMTRLLAVRLGHIVETAGTIQEALTALQNALDGQRTFDLVVCDIGLPDGSGLDLMPQLLKLLPTVQGIAVTGYGSDEDIARSAKAGFFTHLTKPIRLSTLEDVVTAVAMKIANEEAASRKSS